MSRILTDINIKYIADLVSAQYSLSKIPSGSNVNKYARYKAVTYNLDSGPLSEEQFMSVNYGLTITNQTVIEGGRDIQKVIGPWNITYNKPTSKFRLTDWIGYAPTASFPVGGFLSTTYTPSSTGSITMTFTTGSVPSAEVPLSGYMPHTDIRNKYLGVLLREVSGSSVMLWTKDGLINSDYTFNSSALTFTIPTSTLYGKTYDAYLVIANGVINGGEVNTPMYGSQVAGLSTSYKIVPIPNTETRITITNVSWSTYFPTWSVSGGVYSSGSKRYIRIIVTGKSISASGYSVSSSVIIQKNGSTIYTKGATSEIFTTTQKSQYLDIEVSAVVYNDIMNGSRDYTFTVNSAYSTLTTSRTGTVTNR